DRQHQLHDRHRLHARPVGEAQARQRAALNMDAKVAKVLRRFEKRSAKESQRMHELNVSNRDEFLLSVGPETGELIHLLAKEARAKTILEVGSSYGYSTVWLADAARETGGRVISLELHAAKQEH